MPLEYKSADTYNGIRRLRSSKENHQQSKTVEANQEKKIDKVEETEPLKLVDAGSDSPGHSTEELDALHDSTVVMNTAVPDRAAGPNVNTLGDTKDQAQELTRERGGKGDKFLNSIFAGHYQIIDFIGIGGMGKVYKANHTLLRRLVAIKFLQESKIGHDEGTLRRFQQEAQTVVKLSHPRIPALREFGVTDQIPFIVMDYVEGQSLGSLITEKTLTPQEICTVGAQICNAMEHAHQNKIIHRDIKPSNILVKLDSETDPAAPSASAIGAKAKRTVNAYLLDFGIAKVVDAIHDSRLTGTGELVGTVRYMSPEQFNGFPASPSSDIYSLGCVLFEALQGQPPFMGNSRMELIRKHQEDEPPDLPSSVPSYIQNIVYRCLSKSPERRYQSAAALQADLERAASGQSPDFLVPRIKSAQYKWILTAAVTLPCVVGLLFLFSLPKEEDGFEKLNDQISLGPESKTSAPLYFARAEKYFKNKSYQQALYDYDHAAKLDPQNSKAFHKAATCFFETGDHSSAIKYANEALKIDPRDSEAMFIAAAAKAKLGRLVEATEDYSGLLESIPETLSELRLATLNNRSNNYFVMGKNEAALADAKAVLKMQPENKGAHLNRAEIMMSMRQYENAFDDVNTVLKSDPKSDRAHELRGRIHMLKKDHSKAIEDFTDAINLGRKSPEIYLDRAKAHQALGDNESALNDSKQAVLVETSNPTPKFYHAYFLSKSGKYKESLIETEALLTVYKRDADLWLLKATALAKTGQKSEAEKIVNSITEKVSAQKNALKVNPDFLQLAQESIK